MFKSLRIGGFRTFRTFEMERLTRVNLLVGPNNAGKTSLLEAGEILAVGGAPWILLRSPTRRGDGVLPVSTPLRESMSIRHLFHGHELKPGASFEISDPSNAGTAFVRCELVPGSPIELTPQVALLLSEPVDADASLDFEVPLALTIEGHNAERKRTVPLGPDARLPIALVGRAEDSEPPSNFVAATDPEYRLSSLWDRIVLTPNEDRVTDALRIIEPRIERVASLSRPSTLRTPPTIVLRLKGVRERIPIGSMGDGLRRLLALSVNLVNSTGGYLFVDEIDTGLHHTVLTSMWRLLVETARRLEVQVFASTHSLDCLQALARAYKEDDSMGAEISVHRIGRGTERGVAYSAEEIVVAVDQEMEIR